MRYSVKALKDLCELYGLSRIKLARRAGIKNYKSVYDYFEGVEPDSITKKRLGEIFGVYFVDDWDWHINNDESLNKLKASLLVKSKEAYIERTGNVNIEKYTPNNAEMKVFVLNEMAAEDSIVNKLTIKAEDEIINKLTVKESIGKGFDFANVRSLSLSWSKFRLKNLPPVLSFQKTAAITDEFIEYMAANKKDKTNLFHDKQFIAETFEFVSRKMVEENYLKNNILSVEAKKQAMQIIMLPKIRSYVHEAFSRAVKKINNQDNVKILDELKDQLVNDFVEMFKTGEIKEIESNE